MSFIAFPGWLVTFADLDFGWMFLPFSFRLHPLFVSYVCGWVGALPFVRFSWRRLSFFVVPFSFPGCGCLRFLVDVCGLFCGYVGPEARTGRVFSTLLVVCGAGLRFRLRCFGDFRFFCFLPVGTPLVCSPALWCSGVGLFFLEGHSLPEVVRGLGPLSVGLLPCGHFYLLRLLLFDRRDLNQLSTERNYRRIFLDAVPKLGLVRV